MKLKPSLCSSCSRVLPRYLSRPNYMTVVEVQDDEGWFPENAARWWKREVVSDAGCACTSSSSSSCSGGLLRDSRHMLRSSRASPLSSHVSSPASSGSEKNTRKRLLALSSIIIWKELSRQTRTAAKPMYFTVDLSLHLLTSDRSYTSRKTFRYVPRVLVDFDTSEPPPPLPRHESRTNRRRP
jgi:hypothetical protein